MPSAWVGHANSQGAAAYRSGAPECITRRLSCAIPPDHLDHEAKTELSLIVYNLIVARLSMDDSNESQSPTDVQRVIDKVERARELNQQAMRCYQDEMDRMMAATMSPWLAVTIGCIVGAGAFAAGAITAKMFWI